MAPHPFNPAKLVAGDLVAVFVPGLTRPLYGLLLGKSPGRDGEIATVHISSARGERTMDVPLLWLRPWQQRRPRATS